MKNAITCPKCGVEEPFAAGTRPVPMHEVGRFRCEACSAVYVHGKLAPPFVVEPFLDVGGVTWVRVRVQDPQTREDVYVFDIEPRFAVPFAKNVLSIAVP